MVVDIVQELKRANPSLVYGQYRVSFFDIQQIYQSVKNYKAISKVLLEFKWRKSMTVVYLSSSVSLQEFSDHLFVKLQKRLKENIEEIQALTHLIQDVHH